MIVERRKNTQFKLIDFIVSIFIKAKQGHNVYTH